MICAPDTPRLCSRGTGYDIHHLRTRHTLSHSVDSQLDARLPHHYLRTRDTQVMRTPDRYLRTRETQVMLPTIRCERDTHRLCSRRTGYAQGARPDARDALLLEKMDHSTPGLRVTKKETTHGGGSKPARPPDNGTPTTPTTTPLATATTTTLPCSRGMLNLDPCETVASKPAFSVL